MRIQIADLLRIVEPRRKKHDSYKKKSVYVSLYNQQVTLLLLQADMNLIFSYEN